MSIVAVFGPNRNIIGRLALRNASIFSTYFKSFVKEPAELVVVTGRPATQCKTCPGCTNLLFSAGPGRVTKPVTIATSSNMANLNPNGPGLLNVTVTSGS